MKANKSEQKALLSLLNRIYREIRTVEEEWDIHIDQHDFRPRIEYFHDAVRAFFEAGGKGTEGKGRLSVEMLAYDIGMLRYIQHEPVPKIIGKIGKLSAQTDMTPPLPRVRGDKSGLRPDSSVKHKLVELYTNYAVMFSALLAEASDRNFKSRMESCNEEIEDLADWMRTVAAKAKKSSEIDLEALADDHIKTPELMDRVRAAMQGGKLKKRMQAEAAMQKLKEVAQAVEKEAQTIETAHFTYATGQLAIYEGARDAIKKLAVKGFNIVGDFVASAVAEAQRGQQSR